MKLDPTSRRGNRTTEQLTKLLTAIDRIVEKPEPVASKPQYERMNLVLAIKKATEEFHDEWRARPGKDFKPRISKEHWTRIKALSRRLAEGWYDHYDNLHPVADLHKQLKDKIYLFIQFIQNPVHWEGSTPNEDEKQQIFEQFAECISSRILEIAKRRIWPDHRSAWREAFSQYGYGSTFARASIIANKIYDEAAPIPNIAPTPEGNKFLHEVLKAVEEAARECEIKLQ
jgi:hypothetical protein